ncbi:hypothetical protein EI555_014605, partial [Monodon monoceros]
LGGLRPRDPHWVAVGLLTWVALGLLVTRHEGHGGLHENFCGHSRRHPGVDFYQGQSCLCPWPHSQEHLVWAHPRSRAWRICPMAIAMATAMTASPTEDMDKTMSTAYALGLHFAWGGLLGDVFLNLMPPALEPHSYHCLEHNGRALSCLRDAESGCRLAPTSRVVWPWCFISGGRGLEILTTVTVPLQEVPQEVGHYALLAQSGNRGAGVCSLTLLTQRGARAVKCRRGGSWLGSATHCFIYRATTSHVRVA